MKKFEKGSLTYADKLYRSAREMKQYMQILKNIADAPGLRPTHISMFKVHVEKARRQNELIALYSEILLLEDKQRLQKQERLREESRLLLRPPSCVRPETGPDIGRL